MFDLEFYDSIIKVHKDRINEKNKLRENVQKSRGHKTRKEMYDTLAELEALILATEMNDGNKIYEYLEDYYDYFELDKKN